MARVALPESKLRARRRKRRVLFLFAGLALLVACVGALAALSRAPFMRVTHVAASGTLAIDKTALEQAAWQDVQGSYWHLFAKDNVFLYPKKALVSDLTKTFSTIKTIDVRADDFHTVGIVITERQPTALWCGETLASSSDCYFLDENGLAYAPAAAYSGDAYQKYYGPLTAASSTEVAALGQYIESEKFRALPPLLEALQKSANIGSVSAVMVEHGDVHMLFADGFELRFSGNDDGGSVTERFALALQADVFKTHKLSDLEYLDLRFGDKLYYKLK